MRWSKNQFSYVIDVPRWRCPMRFSFITAVSFPKVKLISEQEDDTEFWKRIYWSCCHHNLFLKCKGDYKYDVIMLVCSALLVTCYLTWERGYTINVFTRKWHIIILQLASIKEYHAIYSIPTKMTMVYPLYWIPIFRALCTLLLTVKSISQIVFYLFFAKLNNLFCVSFVAFICLYERPIKIMYWNQQLSFLLGGAVRRTHIYALWHYTFLLFSLSVVASTVVYIVSIFVVLVIVLKYIISVFALFYSLPQTF